MLGAYERFSEFASDFSDVAEPGLEGPEVILLEGCFDTTTSVVPCHNNILNFEMLNRILDYSEHINVRGRSNVGHIPMHENLAGLESHDLVSRHTRVGAANPQVFWNLHFYQFGEVVLLVLNALLRPIPIVLHDFVKVIH